VDRGDAHGRGSEGASAIVVDDRDIAQRLDRAEYPSVCRRHNARYCARRPQAWPSPRCTR
jgi:hypothetical protein